MNQTNKSEVTEIETTKDIKGTVRVGMRGIGNPMPIKWARATGALRKLNIGLMTALASAPSSIITADQTIVAVWILGLFSILLYSLDYFIGVESSEYFEKK